MARWTKAIIWFAAAAVAVVGVGGAFALLSYRSHRVETSYAIDMPSAMFGGGWQCRGCGLPDGLDLTGRAAGVSASLPTDRVFRGVVLTSPALPDELRNVRIMPDGYYLEFADGAVRFVADTGPWADVAPDLEPEWFDYLVSQGVIEPA